MCVQIFARLPQRIKSTFFEKKIQRGAAGQYYTFLPILEHRVSSGWQLFVFFLTIMSSLQGQVTNEFKYVKKSRGF